MSVAVKCEKHTIRRTFQPQPKKSSSSSKKPCCPSRPKPCCTPCPKPCCTPCPSVCSPPCNLPCFPCMQLVKVLPCPTTLVKCGMVQGGFYYNAVQRVYAVPCAPVCSPAAYCIPNC